MTTPKIGDVLDIAELNYRYGTGRLILRVTKVGDKQRLTDGEWLDVDGLELRPDGTQLCRQPRHALVRLNALRVHRTPKKQP